MKIGKTNFILGIITYVCKKNGKFRCDLVPSLSFSKTRKFIETGITIPNYVITLSFLCYGIFLEITPYSID